MPAISAEDVRKLRVKTGCGMMDCKKALAENDGDFEAAVDWLRTKGLATAGKKAGRTTSEGGVFVASNDKRAVVVEVNSETDFVARNEIFQSMCDTLAEVALQLPNLNVETLQAAPWPSADHTVADEIAKQIGIIGENLNLRRAMAIEGDIVSAYVHGSVDAATRPHQGKIGVAIGCTGGVDTASVRQIAMHVAAAKPTYCRAEDIPAQIIDRERAIYTEQAAGKPPQVVEKMVEGRLRKFREENVLLEQSFILDSDKKVAEFVAAQGGEIAGFALLVLGEETDDSASS